MLTRISVWQEGLAPTAYLFIFLATTHDLGYIPNMTTTEETVRSPKEIAVHITQECTGDNCPCCDWNDADREALERMTIVQATALAYGED